MASILLQGEPKGGGGLQRTFGSTWTNNAHDRGGREGNASDDALLKT